MERVREGTAGRSTPKCYLDLFTYVVDYFYTLATIPGMVLYMEGDVESRDTVKKHAKTQHLKILLNIKHQQVKGDEKRVQKIYESRRIGFERNLCFYYERNLCFLNGIYVFIMSIMFLCVLFDKSNK
ncbi:hypothetical protein HanIR_Chr05g0251401 [Helianthus annuus]|nr:hypothetical protein HanIR_Chr05g0251401 [Helianthus annuus]